MIQKMLENNPNDSFLMYAASLELNKRGKTEQAMSLLDKIIAQDPDYLGAYYQFGKMLESVDQIKQAIDVYKAGKIIASAANDNKTLSELNEALMQIDNE